MTNSYDFESIPLEERADTNSSRTARSSPDAIRERDVADASEYFPQTASSSQGRSSGRKHIQFVLGGVEEEEGSEERQTQGGHTSIQMSPEDGMDPQDYFGPRDQSDGNTPEWSGINTPDTSRPASPTELETYIPPGETDGLPELPSSRRFNKQAAKLIAVHRAKGAFLANRRGRAQKISEGVDPDELRAALARSATGSGSMASHGPSSSAPVGGTGVLSSLLRLYDHNEPNSAMSSQTTLVNPDLGTEQSTAPPARSFLGSRPDSPLSELGNAVRKGTSRAIQATGLTPRDRPTAARSGAGVFGALSAGALDLAGVASPVSAAVKPAPDKHGFRLDRYALSADAAPEQRSAPVSRRNSQDSTASKGPTPPRSGFRTPKASHLNLSLQNMAEVFDPHRLHSESHVLRHYKAAAGSYPNTPSGEIPSYEKVLSAKEASDRASPPASKPSHGLTHRKKRKDKKHEEIFITMHVAAILQRQDFILRLARALMSFGAPSHRFESQLQKTAKVLDIDLQVIYVFSFMIIAFQDRDTHTSEIKIIKQAAGLNLHKLRALAVLHWEVMHDKISVADASTEISRLMTCKPNWNKWQSVLLGGLCSVAIAPASFNASFIDMLMSLPLGCAVVATQVYVASKSEILANCFEIFIAGVASFIASALASSGYFCFASVISSTIVLILPGWLVCCAALELQSRSIVSGSVRLVWALIYSLFLGYGISIGAQIWRGIAPNHLLIPNDSTCGYAHTVVGGTPWYQKTITPWLAFLLVPAYATCLSLKNQAKIKSREFPAMVIISCVGWTVNHFSSEAFL